MVWLAGISVIILILYNYLIFSFYRSWKNAPSFNLGSGKILKISVIIPFCNEEKNIRSLVADLGCQEYPSDSFEIILVDDYSSDNTVARAMDASRDLGNLSIIKNGYPKGKKYALKTGIEKATSDFIMITDADCRLSPLWVKNFAEYCDKNPTVLLISSGVKMSYETKFPGIFQAVEFSSLVASGAASFIQGSPIMCNGANLAFKKVLFLEAFEHMHPEVNTGDDMFLMLYARKNYPQKMKFLKALSAFTSTKALPGWKDFFLQRLRWASKAVYYRDLKLVYTSILVLLSNLLAFSFFVLLFFKLMNGVYFITFIVFKSIPDFIFLRSYLNYTQQKGLLKFFIPSQLVYIFFIPLTGIMGILVPWFRKIYR